MSILTAKPLCAAIAATSPCAPPAHGARPQAMSAGIVSQAHQKAFDTSEWYDYVLGFVVAGFLSGVAAFLVTLIGGIGFFGWFLIAAGAPAAGTVIAEAVRFVTRRHRSRPLFITVAAGVVLGALPCCFVSNI